jgi:hypothetical protein
VTAGFADLLSHSEATDEVHALASLLARLVIEARGASVLLPAGLAVVADEAAGRASVRRRLGETAAKAA